MVSQTRSEGVLIETLDPGPTATATAACKVRCSAGGQSVRHWPVLWTVTSADDHRSFFPSHDSGCLPISPDSRLQITFGTELGTGGRAGRRNGAKWTIAFAACLCRLPRRQEKGSCVHFFALISRACAASYFSRAAHVRVVRDLPGPVSQCLMRKLQNRRG